MPTQVFEKMNEADVHLNNCIIGRVNKIKMFYFNKVFLFCDISG